MMLNSVEQFEIINGCNKVREKKKTIYKKINCTVSYYVNVIRVQYVVNPHRAVCSVSDWDNSPASEVVETMCFNQC